MSKLGVLVVVKGGVAEISAEPGVESYLVDLDNIEAGDDLVRLPNTPEFRVLADEAGLEEEVHVLFGDAEVEVDMESALEDCITQMQQCFKMFKNNLEFQRVLKRAQRARKQQR